MLFFEKTPQSSDQNWPNKHRCFHVELIGASKSPLHSAKSKSSQLEGWFFVSWKSKSSKSMTRNKGQVEGVVVIITGVAAEAAAICDVEAERGNDVVRSYSRTDLRLIVWRMWAMIGRWL